MTLYPPVWPAIWPGTPHSLLGHLDDCLRNMDGADLAVTALGFDSRGNVARWRALRMSEEKIEQAVEAVRHWKEKALAWRGYELADILGSTLETLDAIERDDLEGRGTQTIRYPSGIPAVNRRCGGFYGVTTIVADTGVGKSMAAIGAAVESALAGIRVVYFNAELPREPFLWRVGCRLGGVGAKEQDELRARLREHFRWYKVRGELGLDELRRAVLESVHHRDERVLVIVDSVNTIAEMMSPDVSYFDALRRIGLWAMQSRKESEGHIGWILVSETNQRGDVKGGKLGFLSDLVLHIEKGSHPDYCKLVVTKGREGGGGDLGTFYREWRDGRFYGEGETRGQGSSAQEEPVW